MDNNQLLDQVETSQRQKEVTINELVDALSCAAFGGLRRSTTTGLTWGYFGGRWNSDNVVPHGTLSLPGSETCRVVFDRTTGAIDLDTASDDLWNTDGFGRLYEITTSATGILSWQDHRTGDRGLIGGAGAGDPFDSSFLFLPVGAAIGDVLYWDGTAWVTLGAGAAGKVLRAAGSGSAPAWAYPLQAIQLAPSDETSALTAGAGKLTFRMPYAFTVTAVRASLTTAQGSGSIFTVDINEAGVSILSTKLTIDNGEKTSATAATAAVISDASIADDAECSIDIDQIGTSGAAGLKVELIGYPT